MPHATAKVNGTTIAESDSYETVEGNIYVSRPNIPALPIANLFSKFPPSSVNLNTAHD